LPSLSMVVSPSATTYADGTKKPLRPSDPEFFGPDRVWMLFDEYENMTHAIRPPQPTPPRERFDELANLSYVSAKPLLTASIVNGNEALVKAQLDKGADANAIDQAGTPLVMMACMNGRDQIAKLLIASGADPTATNPKWRTPLHAAAEAGTRGEACVELLLAIPAVRAALESQDCKGNTPLVLAAKHGTPGGLRMLIDAGANVNHVSDDLAPVQQAWRQSKEANVELLQKKGSRPLKEWNVACRMYDDPLLAGAGVGRGE